MGKIKLTIGRWLDCHHNPFLGTPAFEVLFFHLKVIDPFFVLPLADAWTELDGSVGSVLRKAHPKTPRPDLGFPNWTLAPTIILLSLMACAAKWAIDWFHASTACNSAAPMRSTTSSVSTSNSGNAHCAEHVMHICYDVSGECAR